MVNTAVSKLDLTVGLLSKAFLEKAGEAIQTELKKNYPTGAMEGTVVESSSGQLGQSIGCKRIYHAICDNYKSGSEKVLICIIIKIIIYSHKI